MPLLHDCGIIFEHVSTIYYVSCKLCCSCQVPLLDNFPIIVTFSRKVMYWVSIAIYFAMQLIFEIGPYLEELTRTGGAISEFVNPK